MGLAPSRNSENPGESEVAKVPVPIFSQPLRESTCFRGAKADIPCVLENGGVTSSSERRMERTFGKGESLEVAINGKKLHKIRLPLVSHRPGVIEALSYPTTQFRYALEGDVLRLAIPHRLGMELYRTGVLPQNPELPVKITIGDQIRGRFRVIDVRYAGATTYEPGAERGDSDRVKIWFERFDKKQSRSSLMAVGPQSAEA
jgi:hypothetical protein